MNTEQLRDTSYFQDAFTELEQFIEDCENNKDIPESSFMYVGPHGFAKCTSAELERDLLITMLENRSSSDMTDVLEKWCIDWADRIAKYEVSE